MKFSNILVATAAFGQCASANAVPNAENVALDPRSQESRLLERELLERVDAEELWKRKGGGGGGGRGGGSSGSSSGSSSSGSSGSSSSSGSKGGGSSGGTGGSGGASGGAGGTTGGGSGGSRGGSSTGSFGSSPNTGNRGGGGGSGGGGGGRPATTFTGPRPAYGGGQYYGGGASKPYPAGSSSPGGLAPVAAGVGGGLLLGSALGFGAAHYPHGAYRYEHSQEYTFHNITTDKQETKPVDCLCAKDLPCGCENNTDKKYLDELIGNGSYAALNKSLVDVGEYKGRSTIRINGTLPEGTTATDDSSGAQAILRAAGWWPVITTGLFMAFIV